VIPISLQKRSNSGGSSIFLSLLSIGIRGWEGTWSLFFFFYLRAEKGRTGEELCVLRVAVDSFPPNFRASSYGTSPLGPMNNSYHTNLNSPHTSISSPLNIQHLLPRRVYQHHRRLLWLFLCHFRLPTLWFCEICRPDSYLVVEVHHSEVVE
jgi:hypothetical protein